MNIQNKLECLCPAGPSSLILCLGVRPEPVQVWYHSGGLLLCWPVALPIKNKIRLERLARDKYSSLLQIYKFRL